MTKMAFPKRFSFQCWKTCRGSRVPPMFDAGCIIGQQ